MTEENTEQNTSETMPGSENAFRPVTYSVIFQNNSPDFGSACIYQKSGGDDPNIMSLAWFARPAHPKTQVTFKWTLDYCFVWAETGILKPGGSFEPGQVVTADPYTSNQISFGSQNRAFQFNGQRTGVEQGKFFITQEATVPVNVAAVGVGMSGAGTFAQQALPAWNSVFTPIPNYWIAFGDYERGDVLDVSKITNAAEIVFPHGVLAMKAALNPNKTWAISPRDIGELSV